jgi:drug/metabolite transporter (DMT)-like permease
LTWTAAVLILISAFMHAGWNLIGKRRNPSLAFFFVAGIAAAAVAAPVFFVYGEALRHVPATGWVLVGATGIAQLIYFTGLAGAYRRGDISLVYPLARALPVLMVAGVNLTLGRGDEIGDVGLAGMVLIAAGCVLLPLASFRRLHGYLNPVTLFALVAAVGTTGYTLIDDAALRLLRGSEGVDLTDTGVTLLYIALQTTSTTLVLGLATLLVAPERRQLARVLGSRSLTASGALTGVIIMATYGLVLAAMAFVSNVSYVAAFRQLSIPIGALFGLAFLGEPRYAPKILGVGVVTVGLVLVGVG